MQKRGQITLIAIVGIFLVVVGGLYFYLSGHKAKTKSQAIIEESIKPEDYNIVRSYAEVCLKESAEKALFDRIGIQGGYINTSREPKYLEDGIVGSPINPATSPYNGVEVPYYLEAKCSEYCEIGRAHV